MFFRTLACLAIILCSCFITPVHGQNIVLTYQTSDSLFVCGVDTFFLNLQNTGSGTVAGGSLSLKLPTGLEYIPGSISGLQEQNISDLSSPVFTTPDLLPGVVASAHLSITATCAATVALNSGQLFIAQLNFESGATATQVTTTSIPVETSLLLINSVQDVLLAGEKGDTLVRTIRVTNTRLGKIGNLFLTDRHIPGISMSASAATSQSYANSTLTATFDGSYISGFGDGDPWLEFQETLEIVEKIAVDSCGYPPFNNVSDIRVGWGCDDGSLCGYDSANATVQVLQFSKEPKIQLIGTLKQPRDGCAEIPVRQQLLVINSGNAEANNVSIQLALTQGINLSGIDDGSVTLEVNGVKNPIVPNLVNNVLYPHCDVTLANQMTVVVPNVPAGDTALLEFDVFACADTCSQIAISIGGFYFYKKNCPEDNSGESGNFVMSDETFDGFDGYLGMQIGKCLESGNSYDFNFHVKSKRLLDPNGGVVVFTMQVPWGLEWDPACVPTLGGVSASLLDIPPTVMGQPQVVQVGFNMPLPGDSLRMDFCLRYDCKPQGMDVTPFTEPVPNRGGEIDLYTSNDSSCIGDICRSRMPYSIGFADSYDRINCSQGKCSFVDLLLNIDCFDCADNDPPVVIPEIDGVVRWDFDTYRLNRGFSDKNNDRVADNLNPAQDPGVRLDRYMPGDTMCVTLNAVVVDGEVTVFPRNIWHEVVGADAYANGGDPIPPGSAQKILTNYDSIEWVDSRLKVVYKDGTEKECSLNDLVYRTDQHFFRLLEPNVYPIAPIDHVTTMKHIFVVSFADLEAAGCLPKGKLEVGDSVYFYTRFKIIPNFTALSPNFPDPPLVNFRTAVDPSNFPSFWYGWNNHPFERGQYSGYREEFQFNRVGIRPCNNSQNVNPYRYAIRLARANLFPYEVRPLSVISHYEERFNPILEVLEARLYQLTRQDEPTPVYNNILLPFAASPGFTLVDFSPAYVAPVDEGYAVYAGLVFKPSCGFLRPDSSTSIVHYEYPGCLRRPDLRIDTFVDQLGLFANTPILLLSSKDSILFATEKIFSLNLELKNAVAAQAANVWMAVQSPSGLITNFELYKQPGGQNIPFINGIATIGGLNSFEAVELELRGFNQNCENDSLRLIFGFGCGPVSSLDDPGICGQDTLMVDVRLLNPELELDVLKEWPMDLCDSSDFYEIEIYNARLGFAYSVEAGIKLPQGMQIMPGTSQISYPAGTTYVPISDPELLPGDFYRWLLDSVQSQIAANGLPGIDKDPSNSVRIRFRLISSCGVVSNAQIIYSTQGYEPCGRPSNILRKPGKPVSINGLTPSYTVQINLQVPDEINCNAEAVIVVQLNTNGVPSTGDSVYLELPDGVDYIGYIPGSGAHPGPPEVEGQLLRLPMLPQAGFVSFSLRVRVTAAIGCQANLLVVQTRQRTNAYCPSIDADCAVYIATGQASENLLIDRPLLGMAGAQGIIGENDSLTVQVVLNNQGQGASAGATVELIYDINGNGIPDTGDSVVATVVSQNAIDAGSVDSLLFGLPFDVNWLCKLLVNVPSDANCQCFDNFLPLINYSTVPEDVLSCTVDTSFKLGASNLPGYTWTWQPTTGLSCTNCPETVFTPPPGTPLGEMFIFELLQTSGTCQIKHQFNLTLGFEAGLLATNNKICPSDTVVLTALPSGAVYNWSGPGIANAGAQIQTLTPVADAAYVVVVTSDLGCTSVQQILIDVLRRDSTVLDSLFTCPGVPVDANGIFTAEAGVYCRTQLNTDGCDSLICQTLALYPGGETVEDLLFCAGDTLNVFDSLLTQSGSVCRTFATIHGCDSTHCVNATMAPLPEPAEPDTFFIDFGEQITLTGPGGYEQYVWDPADLNCPGCQELLVNPDTAGIYLYTLYVTDTNGCAGQALYRVLMAPPCNAATLHIPNVFSPGNGDGINDLFRVAPYEGGEVVLSFAIYSRWGEKLYESAGANAAWDGTADGKPAPADVYVYIITVGCPDAENMRFVGDVTLMR